MIRILLTFIILAGSVFLGVQLSHSPGYVLIAINHWTIETTLLFALFSIVVIFLLIHLILRLLQKILDAPHAINRWHAERLAHKAQATTRRGLIEYSEGYWQKAQNHLIKALPNADTPLLNYLTAARAAQKMGNSQLRDHYLREAQQSMPEARIAVELTQAQLQLANNQWEQALATLRHLQDLAPRHPYVLKLLIHLYQEVRDWPHLIALLPSLKKYKVIPEEALFQLQKNTYLQAIQDLAKQNQSDALMSLIQSIPKAFINTPEIGAAYAKFLINNNQLHEAESLLRKYLRQSFHPELIALYCIPLTDEHQLAFAESLLKKNPHSYALYLGLGRLCIAEHLWGKARHYLEQSINISPTPQAYQELGILHELLNEPLLACECYKKGLELIS
jgi:HemY protein